MDCVRTGGFSRHLRGAPDGQFPEREGGAGKPGEVVAERVANNQPDNSTIKTMLQNSLKIALRNLFKNKVFSTINILPHSSAFSPNNSGICLSHKYFIIADVSVKLNPSAIK